MSKPKIGYFHNWMLLDNAHDDPIVDVVTLARMIHSSQIEILKDRGMGFAREIPASFGECMNAAVVILASRMRDN